MGDKNHAVFASAIMSLMVLLFKQYEKRGSAQLAVVIEKECGRD